MTSGRAGAKVISRVAAAGEWLRRHSRMIRIVQWIMVGFYLALLVVPALLPPPAQLVEVFVRIDRVLERMAGEQPRRKVASAAA